MGIPCALSGIVPNNTIDPTLPKYFAHLISTESYISGYVQLTTARSSTLLLNCRLAVSYLDRQQGCPHDVATQLYKCCMFLDATHGGAANLICTLNVSCRSCHNVHQSLQVTMLVGVTLITLCALTYVPWNISWSSSAAAQSLSLCFQCTGM